MRIKKPGRAWLFLFCVLQCARIPELRRILNPLLLHCVIFNPPTAAKDFKSFAFKLWIFNPPLIAHQVNETDEPLFINR